MNMNKTDKYSNDPLDQAAFWVMRLESGRITADEKAAFEEWLNDKAEHLRAFEEMTVVSANMQALGQEVRHRDTRQDTALGRAVRETAARVHKHRKEKKRRFRRRQFGAIAAGIFVLAGGIWLWQASFSSREAISYQTAIGAQKTVMLSDGSVVTLNTNSEILVAMTDNVRRLHLKRGEGYFEVAKDKSRPFEVVVKNAFVKAVGTAFNISRRDDQVSVIVTEGKVEVEANFTPLSNAAPPNSPAEKKETLVAGEQIIFGREKLKRLRLEENTISQKILWREGKIILDKISLAEIVREIQPYITEEIIIVDDEIASLRAGGVFRMGEMNSFFNALEIALPVRVIRKKDVIILTHRRSLRS